MKSLEQAWAERLASPEHQEDHFNLRRNSHPYAEPTLKRAFEAGWHARPDHRAKARSRPKAAPKKKAHK